MHITQFISLASLPVLQRHVAQQLLAGDMAAQALADRFKSGIAGACALSALEQNTDGELPGELGNFHRVLSAFEENAYGAKPNRTDRQPIRVLHPCGRNLRTQEERPPRPRGRLLAQPASQSRPNTGTPRAAPGSPGSSFWSRSGPQGKTARPPDGTKEDRRGQCTAGIGGRTGRPGRGLVGADTEQCGSEAGRTGRRTRMEGTGQGGIGQVRGKGAEGTLPQNRMHPGGASIFCSRSPLHGAVLRALRACCPWPGGGVPVTRAPMGRAQPPTGAVLRQNHA